MARYLTRDRIAIRAAVAQAASNRWQNYAVRQGIIFAGGRRRRR
jgi:hypothetical protein